MWEEIIATIPQEREGVMLEVVLMHSREGGTEVELRSLAWGNGLGWYRQSTLTLDNTAAQKLLCALGSVRRCLAPAQPVQSGHGCDTKVLAFPGRLSEAT